MTHANEHSWQERQPIWEDHGSFMRASVANRVVTTEHEAVNLTAEEYRPPSNFHHMRFGPQTHLHGLGLSVFDQVRRDCDFGSWDCWDDQRTWLMNLFRMFFPEDEESIGACSVLSARRPAWCRTSQDPTITITQGLARPHFVRSVSKLDKHPLALGDRLIPTEGLRLAGMSEHAFRKAKVAMTVVPRRARSTRFGIDSRYDEYWVCLANPADHQELLRSGCLPIAGERYYQWGEGRLRYSPLVNLVSISRHLIYSVLAVELHPVSAEVLSLRWTRYPLAVAMLQASPIQHYAIQQALTQFR